MKYSLSPKVITISLGLVLYLLSLGLSYAIFSFFRPGMSTSKIISPGGKVTTSQRKYADLPKTQECPINGAMYSKPEEDLWKKRRPLGVMVENSKVARPQSGLSSADVVYEAVAEGGITRFMAVYYCQDADIVGPVRSARTYYLDWISEYGSSPLYAHVGGANTPGPADALGQIGRYGWEAYNDLNQFSIGFPTFWRDYERLGKDTSTEHTVYLSTQKAWDFAAKKRGLTDIETDDVTGKSIAWDSSFLKWSFKDDVSLVDRPSALSVEFAISDVTASYKDDYVVKWQYDHDSNSFLRINGGVPFTDMNTGQQILAKNVVILYMSMSIADDGYNEDGHGTHTLYGTKGSGKGKFLIDGKIIDGTWSKKSRIDRTRFFDNKGVEIKLNRGPIWIEILPIGQQVTAQ